MNNSWKNNNLLIGLEESNSKRKPSNLSFLINMSEKFWNDDPININDIKKLSNLLKVDNLHIRTLELLCNIYNIDLYGSALCNETLYYKDKYGHIIEPDYIEPKRIIKKFLNDKEIDDIIAKINSAKTEDEIEDYLFNLLYEHEIPYECADWRDVNSNRKVHNKDHFDHFKK